MANGLFLTLPVYLSSIHLNSSQQETVYRPPSSDLVIMHLRLFYQKTYLLMDRFKCTLSIQEAWRSKFSPTLLHFASLEGVILFFSSRPHWLLKNAAPHSKSNSIARWVFGSICWNTSKYSQIQVLVHYFIQSRIKSALIYWVSKIKKANKITTEYFSNSQRFHWHGVKHTNCLL